MPKNILMVTTEGPRCGVREYTLALFSAYRTVAPEDRIYLVPLTENPDRIFSPEGSILHIQFQEFPYRGGILEAWLDRAEEAGWTPMITFHDTVIPEHFPHWRLRAGIAHTPTMKRNLALSFIGLNMRYIPMGAPQPPYQVLSFGLGRTDRDLVQKVCDSLGMAYTYLNGSEDWIPREDLVRHIRGSDAVVLWYPEEFHAGSSYCARMALGCRRPLVTNAVTWFEGIDSPLHRLCHTQEDLSLVLSNLRSEAQATIFSMQDTAREHEKLYAALGCEGGE